MQRNYEQVHKSVLIYSLMNKILVNNTQIKDQGNPLQLLKHFLIRIKSTKSPLNKLFSANDAILKD